MEVHLGNYVVEEGKCLVIATNSGEHMKYIEHLLSEMIRAPAEKVGCTVQVAPFSIYIYITIYIYTVYRKGSSDLAQACHGHALTVFASSTLKLWMC